LRENLDVVLLNELKRRGVIRVVLGYLAAAWLLLQIADLVLPAYGFSEKTMATLINIVVVGVIPAAILAWAFEWTSEGIALDKGQAIPAWRARRMDRAIIVVLLLAVGYFTIDKFFIEPRLQVQIDRSIAVLPFINMSSDPEQDYFSDGIAEELLNLLAKVHELRVVSRSSSFAYRGKDINIPEVGNALNVAYVLEGSVRKAGDRIRVTAQLIEAATDRHLWSDTYDRDLIDVFAIQDEVAAQIIEQLKVELTGEAPHAYRTDPKTYALFLLAKARLMEIGLYGDPEAVRIMEEVAARDPNYVPALMYLAPTISYESGNHGDEAIYPGESADRKINELVDRTLAIDPKNAHALAYKAWRVFSEDRDIPQAARSIEKALENDASNGLVLRPAMMFALFIGDFESRRRLAQRAVERDPACIHCMSDYVHELLRADNLDEAEAIARARMSMAPNGERELGEVYMARGDYDKAFNLYSYIPWENERLIRQAHALFAAGDVKGFEQLKAEYLAKFGNPLHTAMLYAIEGDSDSALEFLQLAYSKSAERFGLIMWDPEFAGLRGEPGWEELRERAGLSEAQIAGTRLNLPDGI
jgi:TolB-like protein/thioredoxin-like negative regulator of GroEL